MHYVSQVNQGVCNSINLNSCRPVTWEKNIYAQLDLFKINKEAGKTVCFSSLQLLRCFESFPHTHTRKKTIQINAVGRTVNTKLLQ